MFSPRNPSMAYWLRPVINSLRAVDRIAKMKVPNDYLKLCTYCGGQHRIDRIHGLRFQTHMRPPMRKLATTTSFEHPVLSAGSLKESFLRSLETRLLQEIDYEDVDDQTEQICVSSLRKAWSQLPIDERQMYIEEQPPDDVFNQEFQYEMMSMPDIGKVFRQIDGHQLSPPAATDASSDPFSELHPVFLTKYQLFLWKKLKEKPEKDSMREHVREIAKQWQSMSENSQKNEFTVLIECEQSLKEELEMVEACCNLFSLEDKKLTWVLRKLGMPQSVPTRIALYLVAAARKKQSVGSVADDIPWDRVWPEVSEPLGEPFRHEHQQLAMKYKTEIFQWVELMKKHENANVRKYFKMGRVRRRISILQNIQDFSKLTVGQRKALYSQLRKPEPVTKAHSLYRRHQREKLSSDSGGSLEDTKKWWELADAEKLVYLEEYARKVDSYYVEVGQWEAQMREHHLAEVRGHFQIPQHYAAAKSPQDAFLQSSIRNEDNHEHISHLIEEWKLMTAEEREPYDKLHLEARKKWHLLKYEWEEKKKVQTLLEKLKLGLMKNNRKKEMEKSNSERTLTQWVYELD